MTTSTLFLAIFRYSVTRNFYVYLLIAMSFWGVIYFEPRLEHSGFAEQLTVGGGILADADKNRDIRFAWWAISWQVAAILAITIVARQVFVIWQAVFFTLLAAAGLLTLDNLVSLDSPHFQTQALFCSLLASAAIAFVLDKANWHHAFGIGFLIATSACVLVNLVLDFNAAWTIAIALPAAVLWVSNPRSAILQWAILIGGVIMATTLMASAPVLWIGLEGARPSLFDGLHSLLAISIIIEAIWMFRSRDVGGATQVKLPRLSIATAIVVLTGPALYLPAIPVDDYHFGEKLLAAQAFYSSAGWFTEFLSPHGLSNAAGGFAAWLVGDPTASGILVGERLVLLYAWGALIGLLLFFLGPVPALLFALIMPQSPHFIYFPLNLVLGLAIVTHRHPFVAGVGGVAFAAFGALFNGGLGAAASIFIALSGIILHARRGRRDFTSFCVGSMVSGAAVIAIFHEQVTGQLAFLSVSSAANLTIYGNGDFSVIDRNFDNFLYAFAPLLTLAIAALVGSTQRSEGRATDLWWTSLLLIVPTTALAVIINAYAAGRLDSTGSRGMIATVALLVVATVWVSCFFERREQPVIASLLSFLLIGIAVDYRTGFGRLALPPTRLEHRNMIAVDMPTLGSGMAQPGHLAMLLEVCGVVNSVLEPDETFLNLTNRNSFYFYCDRANPVPIASTYNAAPEEFQRQYIEASENSFPALAILSVDNFEHDGISLPLRSYRIYEFVEAHYVPFIANGNVYGIRTDLSERLTRLTNPETLIPNITQSFRTGTYDDANWRNGVAIDENAALWSFAVQAGLAGLLETGDRLRFSDGVDREVTRADGVRVNVTPPLPTSFANSPTQPTFTVVNRSIAAEEIWGNVLHQPYLWRIPAAWGRSAETLLEKLGNVQQLTGPVLYGTVVQADTMNLFRITSDDPIWVYTFAEPLMPLGGGGILSLDVECVGSDVHPMVQVFWRSPDTAFSERNSVTFEASYRTNLVPLDTTPRWRSMPGIAEIRIDVANPSACGLVSLSNVAMHERL